MLFFPLIYVKMPTIVGILTSMSGENFMLNWVEHEKSFITSGPGVFQRYLSSARVSSSSFPAGLKVLTFNVLIPTDKVKLLIKIIFVLSFIIKSNSIFCRLDFYHSPTVMFWYEELNGTSCFVLTLKAPITTVADDSLEYFFLVFLIK